MPCLGTSMGRGLLDADHSLDATKARSFALSQCDVALVVGARLNWLLHFGDFPRWRRDCRFILINVDVEEIEVRSTGNPRSIYGLCGDAKVLLPMLVRRVRRHPPEEWTKKISQVVLRQKEQTPIWEPSQLVVGSTRLEASFQLRFDEIFPVIQYHLDSLPIYPVIVAEGANTMDRCRVHLSVRRPRGYLDAGTWGTMGCALGYAIANALHAEPNEFTVVIQGRAVAVPDA